MNLDQNKALVRRAIEEVWNKGDLSVLTQVYDPGFISHQSSQIDERDVRGAADLGRLVGTIRAAFPDFHDTIDDQVAEGDKVTTRVTSEGTHQGVWFSIQPTNKHARWMAIVTDRIQEGRIVEEWVTLDFYGLLQQLFGKFTVGQAGFFR